VLIGLAGSVAYATSAAVPILPSRDLERSRAYYAFLGFTVLDLADDYLRVGHDGVEVHLYLSPDTDPKENPGGWYLRAAEPEELRGKWSADGLECLDVPAPSHYGTTVFALIDPDGNMLRVGPVTG
jgi:catechol 2,3-dioxygenase-like lactoylglutathione lyase family enzyme